MTSEQPTRKRARGGRWTARRLALTIARFADEKQGAGTVVLDVGQAIQVADYFVITEGENRRHLGAIAEHVARELKRDGFHRMGGSPTADENWVLLDYGPVVLHVMSPKARAYYDLENLWGDCRRLRWRRRVPRPGDAGPPHSDPTE